MATHSALLAWRIPWTEDPGGLQPTGPQRARHARSDLAREAPVGSRGQTWGPRDDMGLAARCGGR